MYGRQQSGVQKLSAMPGLVVFSPQKFARKSNTINFQALFKITESKPSGF